MLLLLVLTDSEGRSQRARVDSIIDIITPSENRVKKINNQLTNADLTTVRNY